MNIALVPKFPDAEFKTCRVMIMVDHCAECKLCKFESVSKTYNGNNYHDIEFNCAETKTKLTRENFDSFIPDNCPFLVKEES